MLTDTYFFFFALLLMLGFHPPALANDYGILFEFARTTIFPGDPAPFSLLNPGVVNGRLPGMFKRMGFHDSAAIKDYQ